MEEAYSGIKHDYDLKMVQVVFENIFVEVNYLAGLIAKNGKEIARGGGDFGNIIPNYRPKIIILTT